ncbi:MAG: hypothetical protein FD149_2468 [Rhodospirillaceae bacterium]|nr:MAG: hypothetical protein FD149_2468 [Rhodospirillaceae bacterium]
MYACALTNALIDNIAFDSDVIKAMAGPLHQILADGVIQELGEILNMKVPPPRFHEAARNIVSALLPHMDSTEARHHVGKIVATALHEHTRRVIQEAA